MNQSGFRPGDSTIYQLTPITSIFMNQSGFRPGDSTIYQLTLITSHIYESIRFQTR